MSVVRGVSVMTIGPALGHDVEVDEAGLQMALELCQARGRVKLIDRHDGEFEDIVGAITNFRIEGDQLKGDAELLENHPMRARILEIAEKIPEEFGLSVEHDYETVDGFYRPSDIYAVALVPRPAANARGLFSSRKAWKTSNDPVSRFRALVSQKRREGQRQAFSAAAFSDPKLYAEYRALAERHMI